MPLVEASDSPFLPLGSIKLLCKFPLILGVLLLSSKTSSLSGAMVGA